MEEDLQIPTLILSDVQKFSFCVNCSKPLISELDQQEEDSEFSNPKQPVYLIAVPTISESGNNEESTINEGIRTVRDTLSDLYKLHYLPSFKTNDCDNSDPMDLCFHCSQVLTHLFKWYSEFQELRACDSSLGQLIKDLNQFIERHINVKIDDNKKADNYYEDAGPWVSLRRLTTQEIVKATGGRGQNSTLMDHRRTRTKNFNQINDFSQNFDIPLDDDDGHESDFEPMYQQSDNSADSDVDWIMEEPRKKSKRIKMNFPSKTTITKDSQGDSSQFGVMDPLELSSTMEDNQNSESQSSKSSTTKESENPELKRFRCTFLPCPKSFKKRYDLTCHLRTHTGDKPYRCQYCSRTFGTGGNLTAHMKMRHPEEKKLWDKEKNERIKQQKSISRKVLPNNNKKRNENDPSIIQSESKESSEDKMFKCPHSPCTKSFRKRWDLNCHIRSIHTGERPYTCNYPHCSKKFASGSNWKAHMRRRHSENSKKPERVESKTEKEDDQFFVKKSKRKQNPRNDNESKMFKCTFTPCEKSFRKMWDLTCHERTHTGDKPFSCEFCLRTFGTGSNLNAHMKMRHPEEREKLMVEKRQMKIEGKKSGPPPAIFLCAECGSAHSHQSRLDLHMLYHRDERNFQCKTCQKSFKTSKDLRRHERIHGPVKNYLCAYCGKAFAQPQGLRYHLLVHTGEKNYKCKLCPAEFTFNKPLKQHMVKVHGIENYEHLVGIYEKKRRGKQNVQNNEENATNSVTN